MTDRLAGKVAIVTGSASGIGRACAEALAQAGAKVYHTDIDDGEGIETNNRIEAAGGTAFFAHQDVTDEARWDEVMADAADRFGPVNVLVNNAGIGIGGSIVGMSLALWRRHMEVNAESVFLGTRTAMRAMSQTGGGSIINISSIAGLQGTANLSAYSASKGAVRLFTKSAAIECARSGWNIRVNSVHPGIIETNIWNKLRDGGNADQPGANELTPQVMAELLAPMKRPGDAKEIAETVVFLASDESSYTTGTEFVVDGGIMA